MAKSENYPKLTDEQLESKLGELLQGYPLYRKLKYSGAALDHLPNRVELSCDRCGRLQNFDLTNSLSGTTRRVRSSNPNLGWEDRHSHFGDTLFGYVCRNCKSSARLFLIHWSEHGEKGYVIAKCGEYPAAKVEISSLLRKCLGEDDSKFLEMAQRCRDFNFGIAAIAYMRRVVEDKMSSLLGLLKDERQKTWTEEDEELFNQAISSWQFSRKLDYAAEILPPHLKPGGMNPLAVLHDLASDGLHNKDEDDCIEIFDKCYAALKYVFEEIESHRAKEKEYKATITKLNRQ